MVSAIPHFNRSGTSSFLCGWGREMILHTLKFWGAQEETWGLKGLCGEHGGHGGADDWCANGVWNASAGCNPISERSWREQRRCPPRASTEYY